MTATMLRSESTIAPDAPTWRPLETTGGAPADVIGADEPLAMMVEQLGRELAADGVLVAWHEDGQEPAFLFAAGACGSDRAVERQAMSAACDAAADDAGPPVSWSEMDMPPGRGALLTARVPAKTGTITVNGFFKRGGRVEKVGAMQAATRLMPVVRAFFGLWASWARTRSKNRGLMAALNGSNVPTLLVDADARPVFVNDAAERLIRRKDGFSRMGRKLTGRRLADTIRLQAAIEHVVNAGECVEDKVPVIALSREAGRSLLVAVTPAGGLSLRQGDVAAIVHVFDPDQEMDKLLAPVCRLYGLTLVESRLAVLLTQGVPFCDAAKLMRVQEQTARSYLKQIFAKTDTSRQAELVSVMLRSAVRAAPDMPLSFV